MTQWTVILVLNYIICGFGRTRVGKKRSRQTAAATR